MEAIALEAVRALFGCLIAIAVVLGLLVAVGGFCATCVEARDRWIARRSLHADLAALRPHTTGVAVVPRCATCDDAPALDAYAREVLVDEPVLRQIVLTTADSEPDRRGAA